MTMFAAADTRLVLGHARWDELRARGHDAIAHDLPIEEWGAVRPPATTWTPSWDGELTVVGVNSRIVVGIPFLLAYGLCCIGGRRVRS
jgi:hypothetical protein